MLWGSDPLCSLAAVLWVAWVAQAWPHVHCSAICHSLKGVRYDLTSALWDLSEVTYLRQLALTKYLIHFTTALQEDCERLIS